MAILNNSNAISSVVGGYDINNSLRLRSSASAWLNRTFTSAGNRKIWTFSAWVKRGQLGTAQMILCGYSGSSTELTNLQFNSNDTIEYYYDDGAVNYRFTTTQVFRDPSAWYHIVLAVDTTQATNTNRVKFYINGSQVTSFSQYDTFPQNSDTFVNGAWNHAIFRYIYPGQTRFVDGYLAEVNFVNAQQLTPSSFGETDTTTGVWKPKAYTGTYGTNGFYLKFADASAATAAAIGKDSSGNGNNWTPNNISVTSGTTYDAMTDSPTNTSATVANYAVMNPLTNLAGLTVSNANLNVSVGNGSSWRSVVGTMALPSTGKWYWEVTVVTGTGSTQEIIGVANTVDNISASYSGSTANTYGYQSNGSKNNNASGPAYGASYTTGDVIGVAVDLDAGTIVFYKNNTSQGTAFTGLSSSYSYVPAISLLGTTSNFAANFGQRPFVYTPPTGFNRLNTFNLPTSAVVKGNTVMDATLYTGNGGTQTITNAGGFRPDLVWQKSRSSGSAWHNWIDVVRGVGNRLFSNDTSAESFAANSLTSFNSNGFSIGAATDWNTNGSSNVAWQWQAGQGSTSSNTSGSITSTVSVNATAGFSIISWTSTGSNGTIGHGLGVAPVFIIARRRNTAENWIVYHRNMGGNNGYLLLNGTGAFATGVAPWNSTNPTSSVISINNSAMGAGTSNPMITYAWAEIAGFSRFGSYVANASSDGPFIYTGFRPRWIMFKRTTSATNWYVIDTSISPINASTAGLYPNTSAGDSTEGAVDILSNGFKCRVSSGAFNFPSGETFIYAAFAENPFKNSLAR